MNRRLPGPHGPALGWGRRMVADPGHTMQALEARYGPVVELGFGKFRYVYLFGPEANEYVLSTNPANFTWREALAPLIPVDGETALVVSDGDDHRRRRRIVQPAFHTRRINGYLEMMVREVSRTVDSWASGITIDVHAEMRDAIRSITLSCLFGPSMRDQTDALGKQLDIAIAYVNRSPISRFDHDWPLTPYRKAMRARRAADEVVYAEIAKRRAAPDSGGEDVLAWLIEAQDDEGALSDQEVRDQVISLIAAGYDTTSAAAAWAVYAMTRDPKIWERAADEVASVCIDGPPSLQQLAQLPYVAAIVSETLRLHCPALLSGRRATDAFELHGHLIPAGSMILYSQFVTHRSEQWWPEPERFAPERWLPGEPLHQEPRPYSYLPFGGGYRRCIGFAFATQELLVILTEILRRTRLLPRFADPMPSTGIATLAPAKPVLVEVTERFDLHRRFDP